MACALSPNFSTSFHNNQWTRTQFPGTSPISLRILPPPRHHQVTLTARAKFGKFDGSDMATSDTNGGDQVNPIQEIDEPEDDRLILNVILMIQ
jgi:hypothetical protein